MGRMRLSSFAGWGVSFAAMFSVPRGLTEFSASFFQGEIAIASLWFLTRVVPRRSRCTFLLDEGLFSVILHPVTR